MSSQKKISSFFMKKANDETIQPGSAGDQGSEELKTGAVADVDVKVIPLESNEPETLMPSSLPAKHLQGMISWMNDSDKIQSSYGTDLRAIIEARRATSKGIVQESSSRDFRMPSPTIGDEDSASCDHVETILESDDDDDDDDESVVSGSTVSSIYSTDGQGEGDVTDEFPNCTVSSIYSTDGQGEGDVTDVFPKGPGALRRPMTADVSCQVFSYPPSLDARPTGPESLRLRRATSKGIVQESSSRDFRMPSPTIGDEDDHVETILESGDVTDVFPKGPGALRRPMTADVSCQVFSYPPSPLDDDDESVVSGSTVSSIYSTDGQGEGDVTDVFPKGPGDGRDDEVTAGSGADFPGLRSFLAEDEAEEEEETEVTLVQHAAQTSPIIVHKAYYASSCGSL